MGARWPRGWGLRGQHAPPRSQPTPQPSTPTLIAITTLTNPGESASIRFEESRVRTLGEQARTIVDAFKARSWTQLQPADAAMTLLVQHASVLAERIPSGPGTKTPPCRRHGNARLERKKRLWLAQNDLRPQLDRPWRFRICLGRPPNSGEDVIGLASGDVAETRASIVLTPNSRRDVGKRMAMRTPRFAGASRFCTPLKPQRARVIVLRPAAAVPSGQSRHDADSE